MSRLRGSSMTRDPKEAGRELLLACGVDPGQVDGTLSQLGPRGLSELAVKLFMALIEAWAASGVQLDDETRRQFINVGRQLGRAMTARILRMAIEAPNSLPQLDRPSTQQLIDDPEALPDAIDELLLQGYDPAAVGRGFGALLRFTDCPGGFEWAKIFGALEEFILSPPLRGPEPGPRRAALIVGACALRLQAKGQATMNQFMLGACGLEQQVRDLLALSPEDRETLERAWDREKVGLMTPEARAARAEFKRLDRAVGFFRTLRGHDWLRRVRRAHVRNLARTALVRPHRRPQSHARRRRSPCAHHRTSSARSPGGADGDGSEPPSDRRLLATGPQLLRISSLLPFAPLADQARLPRPIAQWVLSAPLWPWARPLLLALEEATG